MSENPGVSGGPTVGEVIKREGARPYRYSVDLGPGLAMRLSGSIPDGVTLGLLVHPPHPSGHGYLELEAEGYERQPIKFDRDRPRYFMANATHIEFGPFGHSWRKPSHAAIFSAEGQLLFYGELYQRTAPASDAAPNWIAFEPKSVRAEVR
ncbi:MAG: hypothetical protein ACOVOE_15055 [Caulobacter sp.]